MSLSILLEQNGDKRILRLKGNIDAQTILTLEIEIEALFEAHHKKVLLDFSQVESLSDEGLQMLLTKTKKFSHSQGNLGLSNINSQLKKIIQAANVDRFLLIYQDEQEALMAMA
jgi:anti-anti-sigma factor